jgi:hypothetical protein
MKPASNRSHHISFIVVKSFLLFVIGILFSSCSPTYYVPNTQNVPVMKAKGQTNLSLGINASEYTDGFEFQGAYAITDKWALQLNADWVKSSDDTSAGSGNFLEIGGGYYKSVSKYFVFETYGLMGFGSMEYTDDSNNNLGIEAKFYKIGVQPSISFSGKYFIASLSSRLANLNYTKVSGSLFEDVDYLNDNNSFWLAEPALTLQGGFENIKIQLQFQMSYNLTDPNFKQDFNLISLGLKANLNTKKQKEK